jgi:VIT1/CCC1 family predicted Fe2+/Mn2+ transporter
MRRWERSPVTDPVIDAHQPGRIAERLATPPRPSYLRDGVYGAVDGIVTTFAVVAGVAGTDLSARIVLALGLANLVGDGFSMAAANYLAVRSEHRRRRRIRRDEEHHIAVVPEGEREEIRQILARDGLTGDVLERATDAVTADRQRWVDVMLVREHGLAPIEVDAVRAALATFTAFVIVGVIPLSPFLVDALPWLDVSSTGWWSIALAGFAFVAVGAVEGAVVGESRVWSALRTAAVGGAAALLAYVVGSAVSGIV